MMRSLLILSLIPLAVAPACAAMPSGDAVLGQTLYTSRCGACHSIDQSRTGPKHRAIVGRKAGIIADFTYSPALKRSKIVWTPQKLDKWLQGPSKLVPGTFMAFTVSKPEDRAAIIAYLATQK
jgi:cytochrome c